MREWIETPESDHGAVFFDVSLCVREWIETHRLPVSRLCSLVSLCVREWIETLTLLSGRFSGHSLPLREGVD